MRGEIFNEPPSRSVSEGEEAKDAEEERERAGVVFGIKRYLWGIIDLVPGDCYGKWI